MNILPFAVNILWKVNSKLMNDFPLDYTVLDIETTGLSPRNNEIIELSALKIRNRKVNEEFSVLVNPGCHISSFITDLTGINDAMVKDALCIEDALNSFIGFIGKDKVVGHNVMFDLNFIKEKAMIHLHRKTWFPCLDTMKISRELFPSERHHRLCDVAKRLSIVQEGAHRGLVDCYSTYHCFEKMRDMKKETE